MSNQFAGQHYELNMMHFLRATFVFGDDGSVISLGWVPDNASIIRGGVVVTEAFDAGTTNVLDIGFRESGDGTTTDDDEYATDLALGTIGVIDTDQMAGAGDAHHPLGAEITCTVDLTGAAATTGAAVVWVEYIVPNA